MEEDFDTSSDNVELSNLFDVARRMLWVRSGRLDIAVHQEMI